MTSDWVRVRVRVRGRVRARVRVRVRVSVPRPARNGIRRNGVEPLNYTQQRFMHAINSSLTV